MSGHIRTVIVDDEPPARERMITLLSAHLQIRIVGEAGDVESAASLCARERPDLVFLDVQLPRATGFDLLPRLDRATAVIFVTAYDNHAVRAFEVNALDYLLKPVHPERLARALARLAVPGQAARAQLREDDLVALRDDREFSMVPVLSISHIEAQDNYTRVHLVDARPVFTRRSLSEWEELLPSGHFLRVERSLIVRPGAVLTFRADSRDAAQVTFPGTDAPVPLGRRAATRLRQALKNIRAVSPFRH